MRNAFSSVPALTIDTFLFISIAFWGRLPMIPLIQGQLYTKWLVSLIDIAFMYFNRWVMFGRPRLTKGASSEYSGSVLA